MTKEKFVEILGSKMHYIEVGEGDPILFLHGIPTSSYVWRNIIPYLSPLGRCIAPDLIGFGKSDKPDIAYTVQDHIKYIDKFIETLNLKNITIVLHGWGSVIGFDYAMRHEKNCKGLVFYEAFLRTMEAYDQALPFQEQMRALQDKDGIQELILNGGVFIDQIITPLTIHDFSEEELENYRKPFNNKGDGKPVLQYLKELPMAHEEGEINNIIEHYTKKLTHSRLPKLMLYSVPGFVTTIATVMWAKKHLSNLEIVDVGEELHLAQESNPALIGETISVWLQSIEQAYSG
jgi:haloalkane dehalogenase